MVGRLVIKDNKMNNENTLSTKSAPFFNEMKGGHTATNPNPNQDRGREGRSGDRGREGSKSSTILQTYFQMKFLFCFPFFKTVFGIY